MKKTRRLMIIIAVVAAVLAIGTVTAYAALTDDSTPPVTTSDAVASYWNVATITLSAADASGVAYIYYHLDGNHEYTHLYTVGTGSPVTTVTVAAPASGSATHGLKFWAQDAAGNVEPANTVSFTIGADNAAPVTVASGAVEGAWRNTAAVVHLAATDETDGSGVATITSTLDANAPVVVSADTTDVNITGDGPHALTFQAADVAGNTETLQTLNVNIDTVKPTVKASSAASVARGHSVSLKYSVADALPNGGKATVTIKVKNSAGKVVKTINAGKVTLGAHTAKLAVPKTWKAGTYRFYVYATDLAGNHQLKVMSNRLVVK